MICIPPCMHNASVSKWMCTFFHLPCIQYGSQAFPLIHSFIRSIPSPLLAGSSTLNTLTSLHKCWARLCFFHSAILFANKPVNILHINSLSLSHFHISFSSEERSASVWPSQCHRGEAESSSTSGAFSHVAAATFCFLPPPILACD